MLNQKAKEAIFSHQKNNLILPRYQDYCFANIPNTILSLFNISPNGPTLPREIIPNQKQYQHIILILIDALGFLSFKKHQRQFRFLTKNATISPLTSIFPSTTAAALTTLQTNTLPKKHGLFEWNLYIPEIGEIINTLPFCLQHSHQPDELLKLGHSPKILLHQKTISQTLQENNIISFSFSHKSYAHSVFSEISQKEAKNIPFTDLADLFVNLKDTIINIDQKHQKVFFYVYIDYLDTIAHQYGPESKQYEAEINQITYMLKTILFRNLKKENLKDTLIILTADHGQIAINPKETIYLNRLHKLKKNLKTNPQGKPILATGGPRDVFLHIKKNKVHETINYLKKKLGNKADIYSTKALVKKGLFGPCRGSKRFYQRLGEILILPQKNYTVWLEKGNKKISKLGHHGGLSAQEMVIPFIAKDKF